MSQCGAFDCNHNNLRETCNFFKLPIEPKLRAKWLCLLRRNADNIPKILRICSCHFKDGKKENLPQLFSFNKEKKFSDHYLSPEKKKMRNKLKFSSQTKNLPSTSPHLPNECVSDDECTELKTTHDVATNTEINRISTSTAFDTSATSEAEIFFFLEQKVENLENTVIEKLNYVAIKQNNKLIVLYTGLPDSKVFDVLFELLKDLEIEYYFKRKVQKISRENQLLMTLMKLRQNFPHEDLAFRFGVSSNTVSNIVITWIYIIYEVLYKQLMGSIPSRQKNKSCLPSSFSNFTNCRIILDCTEVYTSVPRKSMKTQKLTFSTYKSRNTLKGLVGVAPNGVVTFLSDLYPGSISDKAIIKQSGIINQLEAGDLVIADKGFLIRDILPPEINLNIPPFLMLNQFTKKQIQLTETIARAHIHVKRAIRRIKCYKILHLVPTTLRKHADIVFKAIGALTNLQYPLIKEVETLYELEEGNE